MLSEKVKKRLEIADIAGIQMNKNFGSLLSEEGGKHEKDCQNHIENFQQLRLGEGDAIALVNYFLKMQAHNSNFYYSMDLDEMGRLYFGPMQEVGLHSRSLVMWLLLTLRTW